MHILKEIIMDCKLKWCLSRPRFNIVSLYLHVRSLGALLLQKFCICKLIKQILDLVYLLCDLRAVIWSITCLINLAINTVFFHRIGYVLPHMAASVKFRSMPDYIPASHAWPRALCPFLQHGHFSQRLSRVQADGGVILLAFLSGAGFVPRSS